MHSQDVLLSISKLKLSRVRFSRMPSKPSIHRVRRLNPLKGYEAVPARKAQAVPDALAQPTPWQTEHMRRIVQVVAIAGECGIHEERVGRTVSAVPRMNMSKNVKHRLDAAHCGEKLAASLMMFRAGSLVKDAKRWTVGHKNICIAGDTRIEIGRAHV